MILHIAGIIILVSILAVISRKPKPEESTDGDPIESFMHGWDQ